MKINTLPGLPNLQARTIYCIGRNYAAHARELNDPIPTHPVIFTKPIVSLNFDDTIEIPSFVTEPHYETELVVAIGEQAKNITPDNALSLVAGYALGIDVTARDIQRQLKEKSLPWLLSKGLDTFAPVSSFVPAHHIKDPQNLSFFLDINGERKQNGNTSQMLFPVKELIATLSRYLTLCPGDLIFTGTPEGVGMLHNGDHLHAELESGMATLDVYARYKP